MVTAYAMGPSNICTRMFSRKSWFRCDSSKVRRRGLDRHLNAVCALRYYMQKIAAPYFRDAVFYMLSITLHMICNYRNFLQKMA